MKILCAFCLLLLLVSAFVQAQTTIYWSKDHIYAGAEGKEIAIVTPPSSDTTAPTTPTGLTVGTVTATSVSLSWSGSTDSGGSGLAGYKVYRQKGSGASLPVGTVGTSTLSFVDQPLQPSTAYTYTIVAFDNAQNHSSASSSAGTTTSSSSGDTTAPSVPAAVAANSSTYSTMNVTWAASTDSGGSGMAGYKVYRGGTLVSGSSWLTGTSFTDTGLSSHTSYSYTVTAADNAGNVSSASSSVSASTVWQTVRQDSFNAGENLLSWNATPAGWCVCNSEAEYWGTGTGGLWDNHTVSDFNFSETLVSGQGGLYFWASSPTSTYYYFYVSGGTAYLWYTGASDPSAALGLSPTGPWTLTVVGISATREIKFYANGTLFLDYTETDTTRNNSGVIGMLGFYGGKLDNFLLQN